MGLKLLIIHLFRTIFEGFCDWIFSLVFNDSSRLEGIKDDFLRESAVSLAEKIRKKELTSERIVKACIERIKQVNGKLNAVVDVRFEEALKEAKEADRFLETCGLSEDELIRTKPFLGIPFTSKESTSCKGLRFTAGMLARKDIVATEDAVIVDTMKKSGAILLGVTNVPEMNLWCETRCMVYGQTQNPYDFNRTCGGSSGGEASIVSACGSVIGLGTDIGGSIRMPSYYCGLFGHKPTSGLISTKGMTYRTGTEGKTMVSAGPMTKHAEDLKPFLKVLLGEKAPILKLDEKVELKTIKVYYILEPGDIKISPVTREVKNCIKKGADHLSTLTKCPAELIKLKGFKYSSTLWKYGMTLEKGNFAHDITDRKSVASLKEEIPKLLVGQCKHTLPALMRLMELNILPKLNSKWCEKILEELSNDLKKILGDDGVLLFPSCPTTAPYHYASIIRPFNFGYWGVFNALHLPATTVPMGLSADGLPLGFQVVANANNDRLTIAVAQALEKKFGGWTPF